MMKILITGICGFVGCTLAEALLDLSIPGSLTLMGLDNLSRPGSWLNRERLSNRGIAVYHGDIRQASDLEIFDSPDWIIDCAANPSVLAGRDGKTSSRQLVEHNLLSTLNLLEVCKRWQSGLMLISTSRVYSIQSLTSFELAVRDDAFYPMGEPFPPGMTEKGIAEPFSTSAPISLYGASKLASETLALEYGYCFDFPVIINRCGVMAGAGQFGRPDQGIFAYWLHSWREKKPLRYIGFGGSGHQVRDCLHPKDLARLVLMQVGKSDLAQKTPICNVSGGVSSAYSLKQLSRWCENRWGSHAVNADLSPRPFDLPWVVLDSSLAQQVWDWTPSISTEEIITEIANFADIHPEWLQLST
jgi:CDP-paratose 2-epimerase